MTVQKLGDKLQNIAHDGKSLSRVYHQRKNHKLVEWHAFCDWVETLPYFNEFIK
jgi:hypothetical protein